MAVAAHLLIWSFGAWLFIDNLHPDTLEIISWAEQWSLGYAKHPPLATWLVKLVLDLPGPRLLNLLVLSQALVGLCAFLTWKTTRLFCTAGIAAFATVAFIEAPAATFYAIQFNHNLVLMPFLLAVAFFGLRYLESRRWSDALALSLSAALGVLAKYEIVVVFISLAALSLLVPRFRAAWRSPPSYAAVALFGLLIAPHVFWDYRNGWPTLHYAAGSRPLATALDLLESLNQLFAGTLLLVVGPILAALVFRDALTGNPVNARLRLGAYLVAAPVVVLAALSLVSAQVIRQGWVLPLVALATVGVALLLGARAAIHPTVPARFGQRAILVSAGQLAMLVLFLALRTGIAHPVSSYSFDASEFGRDVQGFWSARAAGSLGCVSAPLGQLGMSVVGTLEPLPRFVELGASGSGMVGGPLPCSASGGVVIVGDGSLEAEALSARGLDSAMVAVPAESALGDYKWRMQVFLVRPTAARLAVTKLGPSGRASPVSLAAY